MQTYLQKLPLLVWARYTYIAGIILSLIGLIPAPWFPLQLGKLVVAVSFILISGILFLLGGGLRGVIGKRDSLIVWLVALLPASYLLSYAVSTDRSVGILGYSIEVDTLCFVTVASIIFLLSFFLFRRLGTIRLLLAGVSAATLVAMAFQFVSILFGTKILPQAFSDASINLVGKWNDLGLLVGLFLLLLLVALEYADLSRPRRIVGICLALVSVLFLALVQYPLIWALLLGASLILGVWSFVTHKKKNWIAIGTGVISIFFLLWGAAVGSSLTKVLHVSSFEVRPSFTTTLDIVRASHGTSIKNFLVGTGPNTFSASWFSYKPASINQSQFWNLDFNVGHSTFATALGTVGIVGALAWSIPFVLVLFGLVRVFRRRDLFNWHEQTAAIGIGCASVYLWITTLMYPPSGTIVILAFALSGAAFALSMKNDPQAETKSPSVLVQRLSIILAVLVLVLLAGSDVYAARRYMTEVHTNQGAIALTNNDVSGALNSANAALAVERTGDSLQFATQAGIVAMQQLIQSTTTPSTQLQQEFVSLTQTSVLNAQQAIQKNPNDYRAYLGLAKIYDILAGAGIQGAYEQAKQYYATAAAHNPTNPQISLAVARLESVHGNVQGTNDALRQTLILKPDYTDAILFAVQLYVAGKDINNAILAAKAAVNSAPGVPSIWFELGLLYYSANDTKDAVTALEQAVKLQSDYANAKYFLGLSYAATNKTADAIQQFKDLAVTNPTNSEVQLILSNLEAGKPAFDGATPPVTSTPQTRETAPISQ